MSVVHKLKIKVNVYTVLFLFTPVLFYNGLITSHPHVCLMYLTAVGYTMDTMYFAWLGDPVDIDEGLEMPQFKLVDMLLYDCSQNYTSGQ